MKTKKFYGIEYDMENLALIRKFENEIGHPNLDTSNWEAIDRQEYFQWLIDQTNTSKAIPPPCF